MSNMAAAEPPSSTSMRPSKKKEAPTTGLDFSGPQSFVTIIVGTEEFGQVVSTIHKDLICRYSAFFKTGFSNEGFIEGQTQAMTLDDVDPRIFRLLVNWLYLQDLKHPGGHAVQLLEYCEIWNLAERFLMPQLQNAAMVGLLNDVGFRYISHSHESNEELANTIAEVFEYVYTNGSQDGPLSWACMEVLLPEWNLGSRSQDTIDRLYEIAFGPGLALDMIKSMSRVGINYADYQRPSIKKFLVDVDCKEEAVKVESTSLRKRGISEG